MTNNTILSYFSSSLQNLNPIIHNSLITQHSGAIYTSRPISALITAATSSRKRNIEELDIETHDNNSGKYFIHICLFYFFFLFLTN